MRAINPGAHPATAPTGSRGPISSHAFASSSLSIDREERRAVTAGKTTLCATAPLLRLLFLSALRLLLRARPFADELLLLEEETFRTFLPSLLLLLRVPEEILGLLRLLLRRPLDVEALDVLRRVLLLRKTKAVDGGAIGTWLRARETKWDCLAVRVREAHMVKTPTAH